MSTCEPNVTERNVFNVIEQNFWQLVFVLFLWQFGTLPPLNCCLLLPLSQRTTQRPLHIQVHGPLLYGQLDVGPFIYLFILLQSVCAASHTGCHSSFLCLVFTPADRVTRVAASAPHSLESLVQPEWWTSQPSHLNASA